MSSLIVEKNKLNDKIALNTVLIQNTLEFICDCMSRIAASQKKVAISLERLNREYRHSMNIYINDLRFYFQEVHLVANHLNASLLKYKCKS